MRSSRPGLAPVFRGLVLAAVFGPAVSTLSAQGTLHVVPDLPGGDNYAQVRDAVKVDGAIVAVGTGSVQAASASTAGFQSDVGIIWTAATGTVAIPGLATNTVSNTPIIASSITPDGRFIASRARDSATTGSRTAVRVTRAGLTSLNLNPGGAIPGVSMAVAISDDGEVLYGFASNNARAARFTATGPTGALLPLLNPGDTTSSIAARGVSADGSVAVGTSYSSTYNSQTGVGPRQGFVYVHGIGVSGVPKLPGGTWNEATGITADGSIVIARGDSGSHPNGEVYRYHRASGWVERLGTANSIFSPGNIFYTSTDGSVLAVAFGDTRGSGAAFSYFWNRHGWFNLEAAMGAAGIDFSSGGDFNYGNAFVSRDGNLVFGSRFDEATNSHQGYVAEFPAGFLANFNPEPVAPPSSSVVGAWRIGTGLDAAILAFLANGTYIHLEQADAQEVQFGGATGFERGLYTIHPTTGAFLPTTLYDNNGDIGLSADNGRAVLTLTVNGDQLVAFDGAESFALDRVPSALDSVAGAWIFGDPSVGEQMVLLVLHPDGSLYFAEDGNIDDNEPSYGVEVGTWSYNAGTGKFTTTLTVDTNGDSGTSGGPPDGFGLALLDGGSTLAVTAADPEGMFEIRLRRVHPSVPYFPRTTYARWAATIPWAGRDAGREADPDHDGVPNALEYALLRDPLVRDGMALGAPSVTLDENGTTLETTLRRRLGLGEAWVDASLGVATFDREPGLGANSWWEDQDSFRATTADAVYEDRVYRFRSPQRLPRAFLRLRTQ